MLVFFEKNCPFHTLCVKEHRVEKSTPPPVVAVVTNMNCAIYGNIRASFLVLFLTKGLQVILTFLEKCFLFIDSIETCFLFTVSIMVESLLTELFRHYRGRTDGCTIDFENYSMTANLAEMLSLFTADGKRMVQIRFAFENLNTERLDHFRLSRK